MAQGAKYDGTSPGEDWTFLLRKTQTVTIPKDYPVDRADHGPGVQPGRPARRGLGLSRDDALEDGRREPRPPDSRACPSGSTASPTAPTASGWPPPAATPGSMAWPGSGPPSRPATASRSATWRRARTSSSPSPSAPTARSWPTAGADRIVRVFETEYGQAPGPDRGPRRLDLRHRLQPRRQEAGDGQPRQDQQGVRRREEGIARDLHRPRPAGLHRRVHARRQGRHHRRRGQHDPDLDHRRRGQAGPPDRRLRRHGLQAPLFARRQDPGGLRRRQVRPRLQGRQRRRGPHAPGPQRLGLHPGDLADGKTLASGSWDGEVRLWNLGDGKPLRTILAAPGFKPGGNQAAR